MERLSCVWKVEVFLFLRKSGCDRVGSGIILRVLNRFLVMVYVYFRVSGRGF